MPNHALAMRNYIFDAHFFFIAPRVGFDAEDGGGRFNLLATIVKIEPGKPGAKFQKRKKYAKKLGR